MGLIRQLISTGSGEVRIIEKYSVNRSLVHNFPAPTVRSQCVLLHWLVIARAHSRIPWPCLDQQLTVNHKYRKNLIDFDDVCSL